VELNETKAESLKEVHAKDGPEQDFLSTTISADGQIKVCKGSMASKEPEDPVQLQAKWRLISACWQAHQSRVALRHQLEDFRMPLAISWTERHTASGAQMQGILGNSPSWIMLLNFELDFRKKAYDLVIADGLNRGAAILRTCDDQNLVTKGGSMR
jgi:hypothetical protein